MSRARRTRIAVPGSTAAVTRAILVTPAARRAAGAPAAIVILAVEASICGMDVVTSARRTITVQTAYVHCPTPAYSAPQATTATQDTIARHQKNLIRYQEDEKQMVARFEGDISRFKDLKGLE